MTKPTLGAFLLGTIRMGSTAPSQSTAVSALPGLINPKSIIAFDSVSAPFGLISPTEKAGKS